MLCRIAAVSLLLCVSLGFCAAEELDSDKQLQVARDLLSEGGVREAVPIFFKVMRQPQRNDDSNAAREILQGLGFTRQEVLQLEPAELKPDDWEKIVVRVDKTIGERLKQGAILEQGMSLLRIAVQPGFAAGGIAHIDVQPRELAGAVHALLQVALDENAGDASKEAQSRLEELGLTGGKIATVRAAAQDALPPAIQKEVVCQICLNRLVHLMQWAQEEGDEKEHVSHRAVGKQLGRALFVCVEKQYSDTAAFKRMAEALAFWKEQAQPPAEANF